MIRIPEIKLLCSSAAVFCLLVTGQAAAQGYPTRPVTIIAATTPGSLPDVVARGISQRLATIWKQSVVVENRAGGAYALATSTVSNAAPDGYTLLVIESGFYTTQPHLSKARATYAQADFIPVSGVASIPMAFVANPALEAKSMQELIALMKAKPRSINYGTVGAGTAPHMGMLLFEHAAKVNLTAVHYRGASPALNDLIGGHIQLMLIGPTIALPAYKAGTVKILAVAGQRPIPQLEGIPIVADAVSGFEVTVSFALFVRAGTPPDIVSKINADVQAIVRDPEFQKQFLEPQALQPMQGTPQEFARLLEAESAKWEKLVRETNFVVE